MHLLPRSWPVNPAPASRGSLPELASNPSAAPKSPAPSAILVCLRKHSPALRAAGGHGAPPCWAPVSVRSTVEDDASVARGAWEAWGRVEKPAWTRRFTEQPQETGRTQVVLSEKLAGRHTVDGGRKAHRGGWPLG